MNQCIGRLMSALMVLMSLCLSACTTMDIDEKNFIRHDQRSGWKKDKELGKDLLMQQFPGLTIEEMKLLAAEGAVLQGISVISDQNQTSVLYFGGNMFHLDDAGVAEVSLARACHANWIGFDYRGYGRSSGIPTVELMKQDALAIYDVVRARTKGRLLVHGHSLGSFIAGYVAGQRKVDALVLESTATNALDWANANVPWYLKPFVEVRVNESLQGIDNTLEIKKHRGSLLVMVGENDRVTPPYLGERLVTAGAEPHKRFVVIPGGGHSGLLQGTSGRPGREAYCEFLQQDNK